MEGRTFALFYVAAAAVMVISLSLGLNTSTYSDAGGSQYERKRARRTIAITLFVVSLIVLALGAIVQDTIPAR